MTFIRRDFDRPGSADAVAARPPARGVFGAAAGRDPEARGREVLAGLGMSPDEWSRRFGSEERPR